MTARRIAVWRLEPGRWMVTAPAFGFGRTLTGGEQLLAEHPTHAQALAHATAIAQRPGGASSGLSGETWAPWTLRTERL